MRIDKVTKSQKVADRYWLTFDDGSSLSVGVAQIADFSLYTGRELTDEEYSELTQSAATAGTRARALKILGKRAMSRGEITKRLVSKGEDADAASDTADWLERIGAIDDAEYAAMIVRHYSARGYGRAKVKDELYKRGISRDMWDDVLAELPDSHDKIVSFIETRLRGEKPDRAQMKRVTDALQRRGFSWDEIKSAADRYISEIEE